MTRISKDPQNLFRKKYDLQKRLQEQRNIRHTRKLSERRERADELIKALREQTPKNADKNSSVHAETIETPLKLSNLVV